MSQVRNQRPSADEALNMLMEGNRWFVSGRTRHPVVDAEFRKEQASGQEPIAAILTCADSRVPPLTIFDQRIGDLFVVRIAGNIVGDHALGSIEYAVAHLHTPLVVVLGHSSCGAVNAVASNDQLGGHMSTFVPPIQAALKAARNKDGDLIDNAAMELAVQMAAKIATAQPIIADYVEQDEIAVVPAFYNLKSGTVSIIKEGG